MYAHTQYEEAKQTLLRACKQSPSSRTWFGVGVACYELGDLDQAEDALSEANILNNLDPEVWAYLTMVCLKVGVACGHMTCSVWSHDYHMICYYIDTETSGG